MCVIQYAHSIIHGEIHERIILLILILIVLILILKVLIINSVVNILKLKMPIEQMFLVDFLPHCSHLWPKQVVQENVGRLLFVP